MKPNRLILVLGGAALGVTAAAWWSSSHARPPKPAAGPSPEDSAALSEIREKAQYVATFQAFATRAQPDAPRPAAVPTTEPPAQATPLVHRPTPEEAAQQKGAAQAAQAVRIEQHRAEPRDDRWASAIETKIDAVVRAHPETGAGRYEGTDCRSQSCLVKFSWASLAEARGDLRTTMARTMSGSSCAASMVLPADDGTNERTIVAPALLDCPADLQRRPELHRADPTRRG